MNALLRHIIKPLQAILITFRRGMAWGMPYIAWETTTWPFKPMIRR